MCTVIKRTEFGMREGEPTISQDTEHIVHFCALKYGDANNIAISLDHPEI